MPLKHAHHGEKVVLSEYKNCQVDFPRERVKEKFLLNIGKLDNI
jgi:hypothetical protein